MAASPAAPVAPDAAPSPRRLRRAVRAARRATGTARPLTETLGNLYVALFAVVMGAAIVGPAAADALGDVGTRSTAADRPALATALAAAGLLALAAGAVRALVLLGPVVRDPADVSWLLAGPVDRRGMVAPSALLLLGAGLLGGAVAGAGAGALVGAVAGWCLAGAGLGLLVAAGTVTVQGRRHARAAVPVADAGTLVAVAAVVAALVGVDLRPRGGGGATAAVPLLALAALATALVGVPRRLARLRRSDLVAGAGLALGLRATVTALDGAFLAETLRTKRLLRIGSVRPKALWGKGSTALVSADVVRAARQPRPLLTALGAVPAAWLLGALYGRLAAVAATALLGWAAASAAAAGLRAVSRSAALARSLPFAGRDLATAHAVVPLAWSFVCCGLATGLAGRPAWYAAAGALVGTAGALRTARGRTAVSWQLQASSPMGALPVGALLSYLVGVDVVAAVSVPWLAGADPAVSLGLPLIALAILRELRPRRA